MPSLRELGEVEVLRRLTAARGPGTGVRLGPGDDAALLVPSAGHELVATTDAFVEGRHFLSEWSTAAEAGARLAAANLSDLAAMAAVPRWGLLSIGVPWDRSVETLVDFQGGVEAALSTHGAGIVGGNLTTLEGPAWFSLALLGEAGAGRARRRSEARPGDWIAVTGFPGRAGAALKIALARGPAARTEEWRPLLDAWLRPASRIELALGLEATGAVCAAIDVSDGLAGDLMRMCDASGAGADLDDWPIDPELRRAAAALGEDAERLRLGPSDDYELILAIDPQRRDRAEAAAREHGVPLSIVGRFTARRGVLTRVDSNGQRREIEERGYDSFR